MEPDDVPLPWPRERRGAVPVPHLHSKSVAERKSNSHRPKQQRKQLMLGGYTELGDSQRGLRQLLLGEVQGVIERGDAVGMVGGAWRQAGK